MPLLRALVTLPFFTGAPEDVATNTFYFQSPNGTSVSQTAIAATQRLSAFYTAVGPYLSKVAVSPANIKYYDLQEPEPRLPVAQGSAGWTPNAGTNNLPEEVAVVLSFQAAPVSGLTQARRRGRVYIGPLNLSAIVGVSGGAYVGTAAAFRDALGNAARAMANPATNVAAWVVYSKADNLAHPVQSGWIDVQPDTQRRRGHKVAGRTLWAAP